MKISTGFTTCLLLCCLVFSHGDKSNSKEASNDSHSELAGAKIAPEHKENSVEKPYHNKSKSTANYFEKKWSKDENVKDLVEDAKEIADSSVNFYHGLVASISVIIVSELGDKTFFIAAIMAMRYSRLTVFFGAMSALGFMTVLSACLGWATQIIPRKVTFYASTFLFAVFGLKMLKEGYSMSPHEGQEEYEEAQAEIQKREDEKSRKGEGLMGSDLELGVSTTSPRRSTFSLIFRFVSEIYLEALTLTFLAEWGDRSQIATIILAARENVYGVTLGGIVGHAICTGFAVIGGRIVAQRISVRTVTLIGGVVFLLFALSAFVVEA